MFSVTYEIVTPESAECGDVEERGFIDENMSLRDALQAVGQTRTNEVGGVDDIACDSYPAIAPRWVTITNGMEYRTGAVESRSIHFPANLTPATRRRIARLLGAYGL